MAERTYVTTLTNDTYGGALNPALISFSFEEGEQSSPFDNAARILTYLHNLANANIMGPTKFVRMQKKDGLGRGVPLSDISWPKEGLIALRTKIAVANTPDPEGSFGAGAGNNVALTIRGASINVAERGFGGGRAGQGRHYLPFITAGAVANTGLLQSSMADFIVATWGELFLGRVHGVLLTTGATAIEASIPINTGAGGATLISSIQPSSQVSVLKSRRN